jgi:DNA ligase-1
MKPLLADDFLEDRLVFPLIAEPKIDGVRSLNMLGPLTGRSLKQHKNRHVTTLFSSEALRGLDGEMAAEHHCHPDLCRITSSALSTITGEPWILWWLFDFLGTDLSLADKPYLHRLDRLHERCGELGREVPHLHQHLRVIPWIVVHNLEQLLEVEAKWLADGFEGVILRDPKGKHKQGRSGKKPILWRIKRFVDFEMRVTEVVEGDENTNEAQVNELGNQFRSSHQAGKVPNGMIGALVGTVIGTVRDGERVLFEDGQEVRMGPGRLSHDQRRHYFEHQNEILGHVVKGKFFPKGIKDKPRFPTFQTFRAAEDMGGE